MSRPAHIDHAVLVVSDWARSNRFYAEVVGAEVERRDAGFAYRLGGQRLNVHGPGKEPEPVAAEPCGPETAISASNGRARSRRPSAMWRRAGSRSRWISREGSRGGGLSVYFRDPDST